SAAARLDWTSSCTPHELRREVAVMKNSGLYRKIIGRWRQATVGMQLKGKPASSAPKELGVLDALLIAIVEMADGSSDDAERRRIRRNRNAVIGVLRKGVAEAAIEFLAPDVVIVDEFQRFKEIVDLAEKKGELAHRLFAANSNPRVLILSATPYKAV